MQTEHLWNSKIYRAWVRNHAKLAYNSVASWLEKNGALPEALLKSGTGGQSDSARPGGAKDEEFPAFTWSAQP